MTEEVKEETEVVEEEKKKKIKIMAQQARNETKI